MNTKEKSRKSEDKKKCGKVKLPRNIKSIIIVLGLLAPGIFLDAVYYGIIPLQCLRNLFSTLSRCTGVTYSSALKILGSTVGVVMTMVNMFLSTSISLAQRRDSLVYGIPRTELGESPKKQGSRIIKVSHAAPFLIIIFLNLSMCITGYLLYFYSYLFFFQHYRIHEESYDQLKNRELVVKKILVEYGKENKQEGVLGVRILFEKISEDVRKKNNWNELRELYRELRSNFEHDPQQKYIFCSDFFNILFLNGKSLSELEAEAFIREIVAEFDRNERPDRAKEEWVELFAILEKAVMKMGEENLIRILSYLNSFAERNMRLREYNEKNGVARETDIPQLSQKSITQHRVIICVLMECRLSRERGSMELENIAVDTWQKINDIESLQILNESYFSIPELHRVIDNLVNDFTKKTERSILASLASDMYMEGYIDGERNLSSNNIY